MPEVLHTSVLTDSSRKIHTGDWVLSDDNIVNAGSGWSIQQEVLRGGKQEGVRLLTVDNGAMQMQLIPTRGMGIHTVEAGDIRLGWDSPIKEIIHPALVNLESRNGLGWLEGFNEWLCRCGLEWSGHPGKDEFTDTNGNPGEMMLTLHGKIANIPCSYLEVQVVRDVDTVRLVVRSRVDERVFHGPKLELWSELSVEIGQTRFHLQDTVTNRGSIAQEMQMLYHCNFGSPLLEHGAKLIAPVATNTPFNDHAAAGLATFDTFEGPAAGFVEQVYKMTLRSDAQKRSGVLLQNASADRGASMQFSTDELPCFTLWKDTGSVDDGYVTGLEPGTSFPHNRKVEREAGRVPILQPGASRSFGLDIALHLSADDVRTKREEIERFGL